MKNQYFGDITDYWKFGILRVLEKCGVKVGVCWMLTPNDGKSKDGKLTDYKNDANSDLYRFLRECVRNGNRDVRRIKEFLEKTEYYGESDCIPKGGAERIRYFDDMRKKFRGRGLVFFDPDTGIEPPSGCSEAHLELCQIQKTWEAGFSLLIIQFPRRFETRPKQIERVEKDMAQLKKISSSGLVECLRYKGKARPIDASHEKNQPRMVFFYFVVQEKHRRKIDLAIETIKSEWKEHLE